MSGRYPYEVDMCFVACARDVFRQRLVDQLRERSRRGGISFRGMDKTNISAMANLHGERYSAYLGAHGSALRNYFQ